MSFELFEYGPGKVSADRSLTVTDRVSLDEGQHQVRSPDVRISEPGTYYWRESLWSRDGRLLHRGQARLLGETIRLTEPLARTGGGGVVVLSAATGGVSALACLALWLLRRRRRR